MTIMKVIPPITNHAVITDIGTIMPDIITVMTHIYAIMMNLAGMGCCLICFSLRSYCKKQGDCDEYCKFRCHNIFFIVNEYRTRI